MTFVAEELTQELTEKYTADIQSPVYVIQSTYAIDRERNIALLCLGGRGDLPKASGEGPSYYALFWDGLEVPIQAWDDFASDGSRVIEYDVGLMDVPSELTVPLDDIKQEFVDALNAYWNAIYRKPVSVRATYS